DWLLHDAPPELQDPLRLIHQSSLRLKTTLDSVLDLARIEAGEMPTTTEPFVPVHTLEAVVTDLRGYADERDIDLRLDADDALAVCNGAESVLHRIATHLVTNAIKFTEEGEVVVHLAASDDELVLQVRDTGSGIAPDFIPHVFDAFEQESDGWTRSHDGIGIGLTIAHRLTQLVGGTIEVESTHGHGSAFTVTLPCTWDASAEVPDAMPHHADVFFLEEGSPVPVEAGHRAGAEGLEAHAPDGAGDTLPVETLVTDVRPPVRRRTAAADRAAAVEPKPSQASPARSSAPPTPGPLAQPTSVLVADAEATVCSLVGAYLMGICEVHTATTFADTLAVAEERPFDVLLLDPTLDGPDSAASMLARLHACAGTMEAFTIALAEPGTTPTGFDAVLTKPLDDTEVLLTVGTVLAR
ncbi:MAG: ATP-binding protein, partial [Bacteroidota bacterium]